MGGKVGGGGGGWNWAAVDGSAITVARTRETHVMKYVPRPRPASITCSTGNETTVDWFTPFCFRCDKNTVGDSLEIRLHDSAVIFMVSKLPTKFFYEFLLVQSCSSNDVIMHLKW